MRDKVRRTRVATCAVRAPMSPSRRHDRSDISWNNAAATLQPSFQRRSSPLQGSASFELSSPLRSHCEGGEGGGGCIGNYYIVAYGFQRFVWSGCSPFERVGVACWKRIWFWAKVFYIYFELWKFRYKFAFGKVFIYFALFRDRDGTGEFDSIGFVELKTSRSLWRIF